MVVSTSTSTLTAFISGPLDPSLEYFAQYYISRIDAAIHAGHDFVIGPVDGVDAMALDYLLSREVDPQRITIYMANFEFRDEARRQALEKRDVKVQMVGDIGATTRERDAKMTENSDYDILRYRTEKEAKALYGERWWPRVSNTEMNERRRRGITSQAYVLGDAVGTQEADDGIKNKKERLLSFFKKK